MKKIFAILLTMVMVMSMFAGCDVPATDEPTTAPTDTVTEAPTEVTTEPSVETTEAPTEETTVPETEAPTEPKSPKTDKPSDDKKDDGKGNDKGETETQPVHQHNYTGKVTKAATCTENGVKTYTCSCGSSYTESIKAGHAYECTDTRPATCSNTGDKTYTCKTCGNSYKETLPKNEHVWGEWTVTKEPTTTSYGKKVRTCSLCNGAQEANIDPLPADDSGNSGDTGDNSDTGSGSGEGGYILIGGVKYDWDCATKGHREKNAVTIQEPSCCKNTIVQYTCDVVGCGHTWTVEYNDSNQYNHTMSAADAAKVTKSNEFYAITCICGKSCQGSNRDEAVAVLNAHAAEKQYSDCGEILREGLYHNHNAPSSFVCTTCGETVAFNRMYESIACPDCY